MRKPAAKRGDQVLATDTHIVMVPSSNGSTPTPLPHPFTGILDGELSDNVKVEGVQAATQNSTATNTPNHVPSAPGVSFQTAPSNRATIRTGSQSVLINGRPAARQGDEATTCNDPKDLQIGRIITIGRNSVLIGG
jgi:uncharacterized Zn-binding protein involved in type VI secretion